MSPVIAIENLSKKYIISHAKRERYVALRDVMASGAKRFTHKLVHPFATSENDPAHEEFWALKDINFDIMQGDRVGIVGRNGAGKSTLLKILSRITEPTSGKISIKGRVASLLEVGTGFHPELTGRENIFLNGAILGMGKIEIKKKFDDIVSFAEVEKFLDTPVKRFSSGMYMRLAFAVAAHLDPEILLVDEVLAVGDAEFQKKCLGRMKEVSTSGRTILFVSHNFAAIQKLCNRAILLNKGALQIDGTVSEVLRAYQEGTNASGEAFKLTEGEAGRARFIGWDVSVAENAGPHCCYSRDVCTFTFSLDSRIRVTSAYFGFAIWDGDGRLVFAASSLDGGRSSVDLERGNYAIAVRVRLPLKTGEYGLDVSLNSLDQGQLDRWNGDPKLTVLPCLETALPEAWQGILNEGSEFEIRSSGVQEAIGRNELD
jgi:lipopolysaccharide transport system ATP-binding protein